MKKIIAIFLTAALALSLTACSNGSAEVSNYSISDEAKYYYEQTGSETELSLAISTHPSWQCGAITIPMCDNLSITDNWYNDTDAEEASIGISRVMTENEQTGTDTLFRITFSGSSENISGGINTKTLKNHLKRYFKWGERRKIISFVKTVNEDITKAEQTESYSYKVGTMDCTFTNDGENWVLTVDTYYDSEVADGLYISKEKVGEFEPFVDSSPITDFLGSYTPKVNYKTVTDVQYLDDIMSVIDYKTVNSVFQHDESVIYRVNDNASEYTYYMSIAYKKTDDSDSKLLLKQNYTVNEEAGTICYTMSGFDEKADVDTMREVICSVTFINDDQVRKMYSDKGTEITLDENNTASISKDNVLTVNTTVPTEK